MAQQLDQSRVCLKSTIEVQVDLSSISQFGKQRSLHLDNFSSNYDLGVGLAELPEHLKGHMQHHFHFVALQLVVSDDEQHQLLVQVVSDEPEGVALYHELVSSG